jgi:DNA polymerase III epsilon subunit-like protein
MFEQEEGLARDRAAASSWAAGVLADPGAVIIDSETTGLENAFAIQWAVVRAIDAEVLYQARLNPQAPITAKATAVHGVSNEDVADYPTFADIEADLMGLLMGASRIVVYNVEYDKGVLRNELTRLPHPDITGRLDWQCAMHQYAAWYGDFNEYRGSYTWQPLNGGHNAVSDCLAVIDRLKAMASSPTRNHR